MQPFVRASLRAPRARLFTPLLSTGPPKRFASESYGNDMSGHQQSDKKNPMEHKEHPGPETPASKGSESSSASKGSESSSSSTSSSSSSSSSSGQQTQDTGNTSGDAKPQFNVPPPKSETENADVKKHNEEFENRSDRSVNKIK